MGILGGSFNPPHLGHLFLARTALDLELVQSVLLVPSARPPHTEIPREADAPTRLRMTELLAAEDARLSVDGLELSRTGPSYTIDTIRELMAARRENRYRLIIGSDMASIFASWREFREILRLAPPLVAERPGISFPGSPASLPPGLSPEESAILAAGRFPMAPVDISSTAVRRLFQNGAGDEELLPWLTRPVFDFIRANGLYCPKKSESSLRTRRERPRFTGNKGMG
jgi:nicotinate-nucleotide adenylyltransferase